MQQRIWVSFNFLGDIQFTTTIKPTKPHDSYGNQWVEMTPTIRETSDELPVIEPPLDFKLDEETQNVSELWESVAKISTGRVKDNKASSTYPLATRLRQLNSLSVIVDCLKKTHAAMLTSKK
jgi:hypothetical protein